MASRAGRSARRDGGRDQGVGTKAAPRAAASDEQKSWDDLALHAWVTIARSYFTVVKEATRDIASYGISLGQFAVLEVLYHKGPQQLGRLGSLLLVTAGNITYVVDHLEKSGWVVRERQRDDRRIILARLTPAGTELLDRVFPLHARFIGELFTALDPTELRDLRRLTRKLGLAIATR